MPEHKHTAPSTVKGACSLLAEYGDRAAVFSGGQSLMPTMRQGPTSHEILVDINNIDDVDYIETESGQLRIGCLVRHADVVDSETVRAANPTLSDTAGKIGDVQVRNRGTFCGAVVTAEPAGDPPVLAALFDAEVVAANADGETVYQGSSFYDGAGETKLDADELVREVRFPVLEAHEGAGYEKWKPTGCAWPVATVGAYVSLAGERVETARLYTGAIAGQPVERPGAGAVLEGETPDEETVLAAAERLGAETDPVDDADGSAEFKTEISKKLAKDALETAVSRATV